jgi:hypothetical protein
MARRAAVITHDDVRRVVKAALSCGLPIQRVTFDGKRLDVIIGEPETKPVDKQADGKPSLEVVRL